MSAREILVRGPNWTGDWIMATPGFRALLRLIAPAERANTQDRASVSFGFRQFLQEAEKQHDVLAAGHASVQPWLDIPEFGSAVVVTTNGDATLAAELCASVGAAESNSGNVSGARAALSASTMVRRPRV